MTTTAEAIANHSTIEELVAAQQPVFKLFERWVEAGTLDLDAFHHAHDAASIAAHRHYREHVPAYRKLAASLQLLNASDPAELVSNLGSTDDLFKSYRPEWVEAGDFVSMTRWLEGVTTLRPTIDAASITTVEGWIAALGREGIMVRYSSGTSGHLSLVPRDRRADQAISQLAMKQFFVATQQLGLNFARFNAVMLTFRGGNHALSFLAEMLGGMCHSQAFLFDFRMNADLVRAVIRGAPPESQRGAFDAFRREMVDNLPAHYERMLAALRTSEREELPVLMLSGPFQVLELCRILELRGERISLHPDTALLMTGGWKSFKGAAVPRDEFLSRAHGSLGILPERVRESYGMTECSVQSNRCLHGRFHVPPAIRPMVLDEALYPKPGLGVGRFAFSDPFASCFPGFFISGDEVELTLDPCACGKQGYSIIGEVRRAAGQEARGCGGVMAAVQA